MPDGGLIWLPIARRLPTHLAVLSRWTSLIENKAQITDLSQMYDGRAAKPNVPITFVGPDGRTPIIVVGGGYTEAAEIEELGQAMYEEQEAQLKETETPVDYDYYRDKHGFIPRDEFDGVLKQALHDRMEQHRKNPVSDPPLDIWGELAKGQSQVTVPEEWEDISERADSGRECTEPTLPDHPGGDGGAEPE